VNLVEPGATLGSASTIVLLHGAFCDASIWAGVIAHLRADGVADVIAPAVPLRGLASDARYVASVSRRFGGTALFVGHSYGGAVANAAAADSPNAVGVVYVAGFALDTGESTSTIGAGFAKTPFAASVVPVAFRTDAGTAAIDLYLRVDSFRTVFAADIPAETAGVMAVSQRPVAASALDERATTVGWKRLPTWYALATADRMVDPDLQRFMAARAGSTLVEIAGSHALPLSQPAAVCAVIRAAMT
jgi:pimeloyl-ACP methyl ester carboxylesterase